MLNREGYWHKVGLTVIVTLAMLAPIGCLLLYSVATKMSTMGAFPKQIGLRWYGEVLSDDRLLNALVTSLVLASLSTALALGAGLPVSWLLARHRRSAAKLFGSVALVRSAVPVIVLAFGTAVVLARLGITDTWPALVAAHATGALPLVIWVSHPAFSMLGQELFDSAQDLGASTLSRGVLALRATQPSIVAATLLAFLFSLDEFAVTFLISGVKIVTLPVLLYDALQRSSVQAASAVAAFLVLPSAGIAAIAARFVRQSHQFQRLIKDTK